MRWLEVSVNTPEAEIDARCEKLAALGCEGFVIESEADFNSFIADNRQFWGVVDEKLREKYSGASRIKFYLADDEDGRAILTKIRAVLVDDLTASYVDDADWENDWKKNYKPIEVGEKLVVVPEWEDVPADGRIPLRLVPGLTFGTGEHPTTRLALAALEKCAYPGCKVLDLGCGSGILSIGALLLGAESSTGCDIDSMSPEIALSNAALNGIGPDRFTVYAGDVLSDAGMRKKLGTGYDMVLANIVADVIIPLSAFASGFMGEDGVYIVSGIIGDRADEVAASLRRNGFEITQHLWDGEWNCFVCCQKSKA